MSSNEQSLSFYFDTQNHYLTKALFAQTLTTSEIILTEFDKIAFESHLKPKIIVHPSQKGSYELIIGILIVSGSVVFKESLKGAFRAVLGKSIEEFSHDNAKLTLEYLKKLLSMEAEETRKIILPEINIDKSIKSKSDLYSQIIINSDIEKLRIGLDNDFIEREKFIKYISEDIERDVDPLYVYQELQINKPILLSRKKGAWGFINNITNEAVNAKMSDEEFNFSISSGLLPLKQNSTPDIIKCTMQIDRKMVNGEIIEKGKRIIKVYDFNGQAINPLPEDFKPETSSKKSPINTQQRSLLAFISKEED